MYICYFAVQFPSILFFGFSRNPSFSHVGSMCSLLEIWACDSDMTCQGFSLPGHSGWCRDGHKTRFGLARIGFGTSLELLRERHHSFLLDLNLGAYRARTIVRHHEEPEEKASMEKRQLRDEERSG